MSILVRPVEVDDLEPVAELMIEMDAFYDEPDRESVATKIANMRRFLFAVPPSAYLLVAHEERTRAMLGIAAYSFLWPAAGTTRSLYLKELYVCLDRRRHGIASLLMKRLFAVGREAGCTRIEWTTDRDNADAQGFYAAVGASVHGKVSYRASM